MVVKSKRATLQIEFKYRFKICNKAILMVYEETFTNFKANHAGDWATRSEGFYNKTDAFVSFSVCTTLSEYVKWAVTTIWV